MRKCLILVIRLLTLKRQLLVDPTMQLHELYTWTVRRWYVYGPTNEKKVFFLQIVTQYKVQDTLKVEGY